MSTTGLLLFAHGARDPNWALPFEAVAQIVRQQRPGMPVVLAFLEFMSPTLPVAGAALAAQGCTEVAVVPLFLGAGGHVRKDLPALLAELAAVYPQVTWSLQPAIGEVDSVVRAMAEAALKLAS
ncbi:sirohydrochlorin chelatase [Piscinibacter sp. HJYY11]|uniref:sirohydrochlorin chelatase n=1 Tax=Piscinibacter sp. HJYY11 TaxID=2801333 RepID=UPI00191FFE87|nr:CbiX/SirB N-terminal domain-containing protein [Piscinibacter sp. HJYY11]MBL0726712.1 CbiX/SirB N-terminal domain-containing protein [Piscinibacter sp. HJYY11]